MRRVNKGEEQDQKGRKRGQGKGRGKSQAKSSDSLDNVMEAALETAEARSAVSSINEDSANHSGPSSKGGGCRVRTKVGEVTGAGDGGSHDTDAAKVCPCLIQGSPVPNATSTHIFVLSNDKLHQTLSLSVVIDHCMIVKCLSFSCWALCVVSV